MTGDRYRFYQQEFPTGEYCFVQLAFVVDDVVEASRRWHEAQGAGPFFVLPDGGPRTVRHRGTEHEMEIRIAVSQLGPLQLEFIEEVSDGPSVYRDLLGDGGSGAHHMCTMTRDYDASVAHYRSVGYDLVAEQDAPGIGRVGYIDTGAALGLMTELVEWSDMFLGMLRRTAEVCAAWDGADPIRLLRAEGGYDTPDAAPTAGAAARGETR